jgi:MoaA/NifB/PqqE/SkfB family radical SAM enzyme
MSKYEGIHFEREDLVVPPFPQSPSDQVLLVTPRSFYFLERNLKRIFDTHAVKSIYVPFPELRSNEELSSKMLEFEGRLNDHLEINSVRNWRVQFSEDLVQVFKSFETRLQNLPPHRPHPLRMLGIMLNQALIGPSTTHLDLHNGCNAKCVYCWFHSPTSDHRFDAQWRKELMPEEIYYPLIDDLAKLEAKEDLLFSGKGEPLLHPKIYEYLQYARSRDFSITLFTNGKKLDKKTNRFLVKNQVQKLYVSLSAASREIYPQINPKDKEEVFDQIYEQLQDLSSLKANSKGASPEVYMVSVVTNLNVHEMVPFATMTRDFGFEVVRFQLLHVQDYNRHLAISGEQEQQIRKNIAEVERLLEGSNTRINQNIYLQMKTFDHETGNWFEAKLPDKGCSAGYDFSRVWANGDVSFCCSPKVMGNVTQQSFYDLWRSELYQSLRTSAMHMGEDTKKTFPNGTTLLGEHCYGCPNYEGVDFVTKTTKELFQDDYQYPKEYK